MELGASLPVVDIGTGPDALRDYAQAAEGLGYTYLVAPDHGRPHASAVVICRTPPTLYRLRDRPVA